MSPRAIPPHPIIAVVDAHFGIREIFGYYFGCVIPGVEVLMLDSLWGGYEQLLRARPHVVIHDPFYGFTSDVERIPALKANLPDTLWIAHTADNKPSRIDAAKALGYHCVLRKGISVTLLAEHVEKLLGGMTPPAEEKREPGYLSGLTGEVTFA